MFSEKDYDYGDGLLHRWGICLVRQSTGSVLNMGLPRVLNEMLNLVTFNDLPTEDVFEAIAKWANVDFPSWEPAGLMPQYQNDGSNTNG